MNPAPDTSSAAAPPPDTAPDERRYYAVNRAEWAWFARYYDTVTRPMRRLRREVVEAVGVVPSARILDVATGTGEQALAFAARAAEVIGLDMSEAMLAIARRKPRPPNLEFVLGDAARLPYPDGRFDICCISFALHEMPPSIRDRVVREMARVTRPGGVLAIVDYALPPGRIARMIVPRLVGLYERPYYAEFVRSDVAALLESVGVTTRTERRALWGNARILVGDKGYSK